MEVDEISVYRLILSDIGHTWVESVRGDEFVELVSAAVSRWIVGWFTGGDLKRGWGRGSKRRASFCVVSRVFLGGPDVCLWV